MNKGEISKIIKLYSLFQFELLEETGAYLVFRFDSGYFNNIEILLLDPSFKVNALRKKFEEVGFSVNIKTYSNYEQTHQILFKGFFDLEKKRKQFGKNYEQYYQQQSNHMFGVADNAENYRYIESTYLKNGQECSDSIYESVGKELLHEEKRLIILEASAGMGKTSTAYEILNYILKSKKDLSLPLLIELTRNRGARIFRHVLDDEIDRNFSLLKRDLIIEEIRRGNILLIIDGFDELLSKQNETTDDEGEDNTSQTMLDTIAELLKNDSKARIVLTSRKSSIFVGDKFDYWKDQVLPDVSVTRYQLLPPTIDNWLDRERIQILTEKHIRIESLSNPVLLSILRIIPFPEFEKISTGKSVINLYLDKLLEREKTRQSIALSVKEQKEIFVKLAAQFVSFEIMSEDSEFIRTLLLDNIIKEKVFDYINRYADADKPQDPDEFANKFVHHALLDRVQPFSNKIGFINDYIFGVFVSEAIKNGFLSEKDKELLNEKYIAFAVEACNIEDSQYKESMYSKLKNIIECLNDKQALETELILRGKPVRSYNGAFFNYMTFSENDFKECEFKNCSFSFCTFQKCAIDSTIFSGCYFINCKFYNNTLINECTHDTNVAAINCNGIEFLNIINENEQAEDSDEKTRFKTVILENFWSKGKERADSKRSITSIFKGTQGKDRKKIMIALTELVRDGILTNSAEYYDLNHKKMDIIREMLGR